MVLKLVSLAILAVIFPEHQHGPDLQQFRLALVCDAVSVQSTQSHFEVKLEHENGLPFTDALPKHLFPSITMRPTYFLPVSFLTESHALLIKDRTAVPLRCLKNPLSISRFQLNEMRRETPHHQIDEGN